MQDANKKPCKYAVVKDLVITKRRVPYIKHYYTAPYRLGKIICVYRFFYRYFDTKFAIRKGDIFVARFEDGIGCELTGDHYVLALLDSKENSQLITIVPLTSLKDKQSLNPASDLLIGVVDGINNGKETVAVINQVRSIDKRRLYDTVMNLDFNKYLGSEYKDYQEIKVETKRIVRLDYKKLDLVHKAVKQYVTNGFISHNEEY